MFEMTPSSENTLASNWPSESARSKRAAKWATFFALTLLVHALFFTGLRRLYWLPASPAPRMQIETIDPTKLEAIRKKWSQEQQKQLLLNKNPNSPKDVEAPKDARYFSDRNIRVEKEQKARQTNILPKPGGPVAREAPPVQAPAPEIRSPKREAKRELPKLGRIGIPFRLTPSNSRAQPAPARPQATAEQGGDQAVRDKLPEGSENLLNAQESVYYSFYSRIYETIGPIWQSRTRETTYRARLRPGEYSTVVDVILNRAGDLIEIRHLQDTGIAQLDQDVDLSWRRIDRFPNPPQALLNEDGLLHMVWTFTVSVGAGGLEFLPPERVVY